MNYTECENYISDIPKFTSNLAKTELLVKRIFNENIKTKFIHVAGTNGKGSVCTYIERILLEAGLSVGKFVSPHLVTIRERISLNGETINEADFLSAFDIVKTIADNEDYCPNYFEYTLLIALAYYANKIPDYIILETGLGGKLDQTNYVSDKKISVITEIGMDHMAYLGDTYEKIASEKAGIIKEGNDLVYVDKRKEVTKVIEDEATKVGAKLHKVDTRRISGVTFDDASGGISFNYVTSRGEVMTDIALTTIASYQCENAAVAIETVICLGEKEISDDIIRKGLKKAFWPGRMERIASGVYIDGAHNVDGIQAFIDSVQCAFLGKKCSMLFGVVADKEYGKMVDMLTESGLFAKIFVAKLETDRNTDIEILKKAFSHHKDQKVSFYNSVKEGYEALVEAKKDENEILLAAGSLYLVGQIKELNYRL